MNHPWVKAWQCDCSPLTMMMLTEPVMHLLFCLLCFYCRPYWSKPMMPLLFTCPSCWHCKAVKRLRCADLYSIGAPPGTKVKQKEKLRLLFQELCIERERERGGGFSWWLCHRPGKSYQWPWFLTYNIDPACCLSYGWTSPMDTVGPTLTLLVVCPWASSTVLISNHCASVQLPTYVMCTVHTHNRKVEGLFKSYKVLTQLGLHQAWDKHDKDPVGLKRWLE